VSIGHRISNGLALAGALMGFAFGAYLLIVGRNEIFVSPEGTTTATTSPTPAGLVPFAIGAIAVWAVRTRRTSSFWLAAALATAAAVLFLFSISLQLAAIAALLVLAAAIRTVTTRDLQRR
jgi:hypothetical protein